MSRYGTDFLGNLYQAELCVANDFVGGFGGVGGISTESISNSLLKLGVPRPVTYEAQCQSTSKMKILKHKEAHRIPSRDSRESFSTAARVRAMLDIIEAQAGISVEQDVEKAEWRLAL
jgi:hypothetical protein